MNILKRVLNNDVKSEKKILKKAHQALFNAMKKLDEKEYTINILMKSRL